MKFDIYGRFQLDVRREHDAWQVYHLAPGKRAKVEDLVIPPTLDAHEIATYLDDIYHELAGLGQNVRPIP